MQLRSVRILPLSLIHISAMLIKDKFNISKAAFKRALGHLMKSRLVVQEDGWTLLTETGKQWTPNSQEV